VRISIAFTDFMSRKATGEQESSKIMQALRELKNNFGG